MREFKKLWKKDKRLYLFVIFVLSLYALIYFGKTAREEYQCLKTVADAYISNFHTMENNLDYYLEKLAITEESFYARYAVTIDNERLIKVDSWGMEVFSWTFHVLYRNLLIILFFIQTMRFYLYDSRRGREFMATLPVKKRTLILYEWGSGGLLISIPMLCTLLPAYIYKIAIRQYAEENHCWFMDYSDLDYSFFSPLMVLSGWVAILFVYSAFILIRYLTNSLAASYLAGIVILGTPVAFTFILESFSILSSSYEEFPELDAMFAGLSNLVYEFPWYFLPLNSIRIVIQVLIAVLFVVAAIIFTEKCKREDNGMFAHKAVKVLFLISIYIWSFLFIFNSMEKIPLAVITLVSFLGAGLITCGTGYLVRAR